MAYQPFSTWRLPKDLPENPTQDPTQAAQPIDNLIEDNNAYESEDELPKSVRLQLAHEAWIKANGTCSIKEIARTFGVAFSTLNRRIKGAIPKEAASQAMQKLSVAEEEAINE
jgi:hypothetical protein